MKRIIITSILALSTLPAVADLVAKMGADSLRLMGTPCPATMSKHLPAEIIDRFGAAVAIVDGKTYAGCWAIRGDGQVFLRYEDGDSGLMPLALFKDVPGV